MFAFLEKDSFPSWYSMLKWGVPLGLAAVSGIGTGMLLTGSIGMPAFFGMLKWAPAFYASLEGFSSIAVLGIASTVMASTVGVMSSFVLRGTILFPLTETIATNAQRSNQSTQSRSLQEKEVLEKRCEEAEKAMQQMDTDLRAVTTQYNMLLGAQSVRDKLRPTSKPAPTAGAAAEAPANDAGKPEEASTSGKRAKV
jgi:hypothetical protein